MQRSTNSVMARIRIRPPAGYVPHAPVLLGIEDDTESIGSQSTIISMSKSSPATSVRSIASSRSTEFDVDIDVDRMTDNSDDDVDRMSANGDGDVASDVSEFSSMADIDIITPQMASPGPLVEESPLHSLAIPSNNPDGANAITGVTPAPPLFAPRKSYLEELVNDDTLDPDLRGFLARYRRFKRTAKGRAFFKFINFPGRINRALSKRAFKARMEQHRREYAFFYDDDEADHILP